MSTPSADCPEGFHFMIVILVLSLVACAVWIGLEATRRRQRDLQQSVEGFNRGLAALDPAGPRRRLR